MSYPYPLRKDTAPRAKWPAGLPTACNDPSECAERRACQGACIHRPAASAAKRAIAAALIVLPVAVVAANALPPIYAIRVEMVMPALPGQTHQPRVPLVESDEHITASSPSVCQAFAEKRAAEQRQVHAATLQRLKANVVAFCTLKEPRQ